MDQFNGHYANLRVKSTPFEKRRGELPIPINLKEYLNQDQLYALRQMESFGWRIAFVRRPAFQTPMIVVTNSEGTRFGVLERDGSIIDDENLGIRQ